MLVFWIPLYQYNQDTEILMSKDLNFSYNCHVVLKTEETAYLIGVRVGQDQVFGFGIGIGIGITQYIIDWDWDWDCTVKAKSFIQMQFYKVMLTIYGMMKHTVIR